MRSQPAAGAPATPPASRRRVARHLATVVVAVLPLAVAVQADAGSGVSSDDVAAEIVRLEGRAVDTAQQ